MSQIVPSDISAPADLSAGAVVRSARIGLCLIREGRFVTANAWIEAHLGHAPGTLQGQPVAAIFASERQLAELRAAGPAPRLDCELLTRQGAVIWCQIAVSAADPDCPAAGQVWVITDISESKRARDELTRSKHALEHMVQRRTLNLQRINSELREEIERRRLSDRGMIESREKYRALIRHAPVGIVMTAEDGTPLEINDRALRLFGVPDLAGFLILARRGAITRAGSRQAESLADLIAALSRDTQAIHPELVVWTSASGRPHWINAISCDIPVRGLGAAVFFEDRSDEHHAMEQERLQRDALARAGRLTVAGQVSTALAHEVGQPLNACQSYVAGLERKLAPVLAGDPDLARAFQRMQRHLQQAGDIIRNVRSFVTMRQAEEEIVELAVLLRETLELLDFRLREAELKVTGLDRCPDVLVQASRVEIQQVLVNLVVNAIEAAAPQRARARIEIRVAATRRSVRVSVIDNGPGIAPELREKVFDPYVTTKPEGLGMGLMICQTILESHGGALELVERRRGARFDMTLQRARGEGR